ncbi:MAG TPA: class I SAM-dependent methyltransferase [Acidimicrobiia bacterium]
MTAVTATDPLVLPRADHGAQRLAVLGRVKWPSTVALLRRLGVHSGMECLDVGCGSGAVSLAMARMVGPSGRVVGFDHNKAVLRWAVDAATRQGLANVTFCTADVADLEAEDRFDLVFARFLLSRVPDPADALTRMRRALRPGGLLVVEDEEQAGQFCHPQAGEFARYVQLADAALRRRGGDPDLGPRLPALFDASGLEGVNLDVVQPTFRGGEGKELPALTMAHLGPELETSGLADVEEVDELTSALERLGADPSIVIGLPRVYQVWGRKAA